MTETADLFSRLGFDKRAPQPVRAATLACYLVDLFISRLTDAELTRKRETGAYRELRAKDLAGYHAMARGRRS